MKQRSKELLAELNRAIFRGDAAIVDRILCEHGSLLDESGRQTYSFIELAASRNNIQVVATLLEHGVDPNSYNSLLPPLSKAISSGNDEMVQLLLRRGADPTIDRPMIAALDVPNKAMEYTRLLIKHGADVNQLYDLYGDSSQQFTVLDWTRDPDIIAFLRSQGAKSASELTTATDSVCSVDTDSDFTTEVVEYFSKHFGKVDRQSLVEVVPSGYPVAVHVIKATRAKKHITLFTTGLSTKAMQTPSGHEEYRFAELFIQLPGVWDFANTHDPNWHWPVDWLVRLAQYPHDEHTWLGGAITIVANEEPPQPLAPNTNYTSLLLVAEQSFVRSDGNTVQLYRLLPIYSDERDLEISQGALALMRALDRNSVPFVVDMNRRNVAKTS